MILHRCGSDFYFLLLAPFPRDGAHKPCFCVWELAAVWHEKQAWERFLASSRDETAAQAWLEDRYSGPA